MSELHQGAREVAACLRMAGYEAYFAGGCVRDLLLGVEPKDYDIVTDARPEQVQALFRRTVAVGAAFGVVRVLTKKGREYEVATYRREHGYSDGRHPDTVEYSESKEEDVQRRDFTINALLMHPESGEVIDRVGGRRDLEDGVLRAVGDPDRRLAEDRLRMLRAVRFAARFGFRIEPDTLEAIRKNASYLRQVSVERIETELEALWSSADPGVGAELLVETELIRPVFPFLSKDDDRTVIERHRRLRAACASLEPKSCTIVAWSMLLDLARDVDAEETLRSYKLSRDVMRSVLHLLRLRSVLLSPQMHREAERTRVATDSSFEFAFALLRTLVGVEAPEIAVWQHVRLDLERSPLPTMPLVTGADLAKLGHAPGPAYKEILRAVEDEVFERRIRTHEEALGWIRTQYHSR